MTDYPNLSNGDVFTAARVALGLYRDKEWTETSPTYSENDYRQSAITWLKLAVQRLEAMPQ